MLPFAHPAVSAHATSCWEWILITEVTIKTEMVTHNATTTAVKTLEHLETRAHVAITLATDHDVTQSVGRALACWSQGSGCVHGPCVSLASPGQSGAGTAMGLHGGVGTGGEWGPGGASHGKRRLEHKGQERGL